MSVLFLTEADVQRVLTMDLAIEAVEAGLRKMGLEEAFNNPRSRLQTDHTMLHVLAASAKTLGVIGFKAYTASRDGSTRFHLTLYDAKTGEMTALMQADFLGQMRTGAASGVATKYLARKNAATAGIFGTGRQARTQLLALSRVRSLTKAYVWGRDKQRRETFAHEMSERCALEVLPTNRAEEAAEGLDIIATATTAREPILNGGWLTPGQHLNIAGSNFASKAEIDVKVLKRATFVCIDSKEQGKIEAGDFMAAFDQHVISWSDVHELGRLVANRVPGRASDEDITLFKSLGIGLEDIAVGARVLEKAKEAGLGTRLEL